MFERESGKRRLAAARAGCPQALGQTLEACRRYLLWIARREIDPDLQAKGGASDLVQDTLLEAGRDFESFRGNTEAELLGWLRRLLLNNLSNFVRHYRDTAKRSVEEEIPLRDLRGDVAGKGPQPEQEAIGREQVALLQEALQRLPENDRQIITWWHQEERSFEEIGLCLSCSPNTARSRWLKAIKKLQADLEAQHK